ncbi:hypothetical protein N7532_004722 [Penicillium argentinense]|uniref:Uncharacterized protein n=1 Tax=Penicillium argentinense TaxID=1131581 RepID=A0A9W9FPZ2_9EURO|nr:uncharacterized protein N7532_004722 [Penicillium argentinense]KAJ5104193.1 hypothetical protein N7532_004722 [Penicillium argentinense]
MIDSASGVAYGRGQGQGNRQARQSVSQQRVPRDNLASRVRNLRLSTQEFSSTPTQTIPPSISQVLPAIPESTQASFTRAMEALAPEIRAEFQPEFSRILLRFLGFRADPRSWTEEPRWKSTKCDAFDSDQETRNAAIFMFGERKELQARELGLFTIGLRTTPTMGDENVYRTVLVDDLPCGVHIQDVLANVTGGIIEKAILAKTEPITGHPSVMIRFVHQDGAQEFLRRCRGRLFIKYGRVRVRQVGTPTFPASVQLEREIAEGRTRCLKVRTNLEDVSEITRHVLRERIWTKHIEGFFDENVETGCMSIRLTSIAWAIKAYNILRLPGGIKRGVNATITFGKDPCDV